MLLQIEERSPQGPPPSGLTPWALGFRPFYLGASIYAALAVPLWALGFAGWLPVASLGLDPLGHAHEMVFGYALAVIVGFLFTAGRQWSGQPTPTGLPLAALFALWLSARVLAWVPTGHGTPWATIGSMAADLLFAWGAAYGLGRALRRGSNRRNDFFIVVLVGLGLAGTLLQAARLGLLALSPGFGRAALQLGLDGVLFVMVVMSGRVVPMFTHNSVPTTQVRRLPLLERAAPGGVLALIAADTLSAAGLTPIHGGPLALLLIATATALAVRQGFWQPWRTLGTPLVWILHAACAWLPLHLLLRALAELGLISPSVATHALTAGALGALTLGMMTRTARGHTGQPLRADRWDVSIYCAILSSGALRVGLPLLWPASLPVAVLLSAGLWCLAFSLYALRYGPWLLRPRADGRPG